MQNLSNDESNLLEHSTPDLYRPAYHFTPAQHWMNDPNGPVYFEGEYHLFYQHNPSANEWGNMSWGHAVSRDLLHWEHLPVAIPFDGQIMAFSGGAVVDWQNSSGFGINDQAPLVLIFTGHHAQQREGQWLEDQRLAYSNDRGRTWTVFDGNPVLDLQIGDFRDPKVFRHAPSQRWIMLVVLAAQYKVRIYASGDLKTWTHQSDFGTSDSGPMGSVGGVWEMPELFELPIQDSSETRWVLKVDVGDGGPHGGSAGQYFIGQFDGERFTPDRLEPAPNWLDHGKDFYAALSWSDVPASDGRRLWIAWMSNWQYAKDIPTFPWRNAMTIPRQLSLERVRDTVQLVQRPIQELEHLRLERCNLANTELNEGSMAIPVRGASLEIIAEFQLGTATEFGLKLRVGPHAHTIVGYDKRTQELFVDRRTSGDVSFSDHFPGRHGGPLVLEDGRLRLHLFVDQSSVEVFGDGGRTVITDLIFPAPEDDGLELYAINGGVQLVSLDIWKLRSTGSE
jgi:fructan beta-fructosidase